MDGNVTDLYIYFNRPHNNEMNKLKYTEFYKEYCWSRTLRKKVSKVPENEGSLWWLVILPNETKIYITKRLQPQKCVVRMQMLFSSAGEIYYLRLLLLNYPTRGYSELLLHHDDTIQVNNDSNPHNNSVISRPDEEVYYNSFQQACFHHNLLDENTQATQCFEEAKIFSTPSELRNVFVILTIQGFPTRHIFDDPTMYKALALDYIQHRNDGDDSLLARNDLLMDLSSRLTSESK